MIKSGEVLVGYFLPSNQFEVCIRQDSVVRHPPMAIRRCAGNSSFNSRLNFFFRAHSEPPFFSEMSPRTRSATRFTASVALHHRVKCVERFRREGTTLDVSSESMSASSEKHVAEIRGSGTSLRILPSPDTTSNKSSLAMLFSLSN